MEKVVETIEEVELVDVELCEFVAVSLTWSVEAVVLVLLAGADGGRVEATRATTDTARTIMTRSARVPRGRPSLFISAIRARGN